MEAKGIQFRGLFTFIYMPCLHHHVRRVRGGDCRKANAEPLLSTLLLCLITPPALNYYYGTAYAHKIMLGACDVDVVGCFPCRDKPADQGGVVIAGCV